MSRSPSPPFFCALLLLFGSLLTLGQGAKTPLGNAPDKEDSDDPRGRAEWFLRGRRVNGKPAAERLHRAYQQKKALRRWHAARQGAELSGQLPAATPSSSISSTSPAPLANANTSAFWTSLGPAPTGTASVGEVQQDYGPAVGRATAVAIDQNAACLAGTGQCTVYLGGAAGGLWKSFNAAAPPGSVVWTPLLDDQATLTVGAIAIKPDESSVVLVGTGEANNSGDSYYGLGILRSPDGGSSWTLISSAGTNNLHGLGFTKIAFATENPRAASTCTTPTAPPSSPQPAISTCTAVATSAGSSGGIAVGAETGGGSVRGLYYSTDAGVSWNKANVQDPGGTPDAGSANSVIYNPVQHKFYANIRFHGFYQSSDGANWFRLGGAQALNSQNQATQQPGGSLLSTSSCPASPFSTTCPLYRAEMAIVRRNDGTFRDEMYVWIVKNDPAGLGNDIDEGVYQTLNGGATWNAVPTTGLANCGDSVGCDTQQGIYNLTLAAVPNGGGTDLYAGAVNQFKCTMADASSPAGCSFVNLTHVYGCSPTGSFSHVHPDQHGIDYYYQDPNIIFFANDGGIYRTLSSFTANTGICGSSPFPFDNLSGTMGSMIQFVSFSQHPTDNTTFLGGTQDNGSPALSSSSPSAGSWISVNNGDGGFNEINPNNVTEWFTANTHVSIQRCPNGIGCRTNTFSTVVSGSTVGGDAGPFYTMYMLDALATSRMLVGTCRVWRGNSSGSGFSALSFNFDTCTGGSCSAGAGTTCTSDADNMISALDAGGPVTANGSQVIYAGTEAGKLFVTTNADGGPSTWQDRSAGLNNAQGYKLSGIAIDPSVKDANGIPTGRTAYVTVMGFGTGHVFKTTDAGATWVNLDGSIISGGLPDSPADAVVIDANNPSVIYVATDVGVFTSSGNGVWAEMGPSTGPGSLPNVAVTKLRIFNQGGARLRASTYGRGLWETPLGPDYTLAVSNPIQVTYPNLMATFHGTLNTFNGYDSSVALSCAAGATSPPPTCTPSPATVSPGQTFTVTASNPIVSDFQFKLQGVGNDANTLTRATPLTLKVVDFSLSAPPTAVVGVGNAVVVNVLVNAIGSFGGTVNLSCSSGLPVGASCVFTPAIATPTPQQNVALSIQTQSATAPGSYNVMISGTSGDGLQTKNAPLALTVSTSSFTVTATPGSPSIVKPGQAVSSTITISSTNNRTINLTCAFSPLMGNPGGSTCAVNPTSVTLIGGTPANATLSVNTSGALPTNPQVIVTGTDPLISNISQATVGYSVVDFALVGSPLSPVNPGSGFNAAFVLSSLNGYVNTSPGISLACDPSALGGALTCFLSPGGPVSLTAGASVPVTANVVIPTNFCIQTPVPPACNGPQPLRLTGTDTTIAPVLAHTGTVDVSVQDFQMSASPASASVRGGSTTSAITISTTALGGFPGNITLACSGLPQLSQCNFASSSIAAGGSTTLTISTTASTAMLAPRQPARNAPLWAFWFSAPVGIAFASFSFRHGRPGKILWRVLLGLGLALLLLLAACGGGGGSSAAPPRTPQPGTPAGTYTITVSGTSTGLSHSTQITLTVQ